MFVVCGKPHAHCFSVVRRSILGHRGFALRPETSSPKKAIVCAHTAYLVDSCHHISACHFAVPVDNNVLGHSE